MTRPWMSQERRAGSAPRRSYGWQRRGVVCAREPGWARVAGLTGFAGQGAPGLLQGQLLAPGLHAQRQKKQAQDKHHRGSGHG
jgi:hypothetical protein